MPILQRTRLECTARGHSKEYQIELESIESTGRYKVCGRYGRIGGTLTEVIKCDGVTYQRALAEYQKIRTEKMAKGYTEIPVRNQFAPVDEDGDVINDVEPAPSRRRTPRSRPAPRPSANTVEFFDEAPRRISL